MKEFVHWSEKELLKNGVALTADEIKSNVE